MKTYQCHKKVQAFKITDVKVLNNFYQLQGEGNVKIHVDISYQKGKSIGEIIGGYFVQYDDGYYSWSPAEAFESGYTVID